MVLAIFSRGKLARWLTFSKWERMVGESFLHLPEGSLLEDGSTVYEVLGVLGSGGFGITYLALDRKLDRKVALKEYFPGEFSGRSSRLTVVPKTTREADLFAWGKERFLDEARLLARFDHPNLLGVTGFFEANNTAYMALPFLEGETLTQRYRRKKLSEAEARHILKDLISALKTVHSAGVLHRDVKPSNIILAGATARPVLIDFGAARNALSQKSKSLTSIVSAPYSPKEQYTSSQDQTIATDIYALGATIYRAMFGAGPPEAISRDDDDALKELDQAEMNGLVDRAFGYVLRRSMAYRPKDRFQSLEEMEEALAASPLLHQASASQAKVSATDAFAGVDEGAAQPNEPVSAPSVNLGGTSQNPAKIGFFQAVKRGFRKTFQFRGRASRAEYGYFFIFASVSIFGVFLVVGAYANGMRADDLRLQYATAVLGLTLLIFAVPMISLGVRRLHDLGKTGWMILFTLIPYIGALIMLVVYALKGNAGDNRFGPPPSIDEDQGTQKPVNKGKLAAGFAVAAALIGIGGGLYYLDQMSFEEPRTAQTEARDVQTAQQNEPVQEQATSEPEQQPEPQPDAASNVRAALAEELLNEAIQAHYIEDRPIAEVMEILNRAIALGSDVAGVEKARLLLLRVGGSEAEAEARELRVAHFDNIVEPARNGNGHAAYLIGWFSHNAPTIFLEDFENAYNWYRIAADQDHPQAQSALGVFYETAIVVEQNLDRAYELYAQSAEQGVVHSKYRLGRALFLGDGIARNDDRAFPLLVGAAERSVANAMYYVGISYRDGRGVAQDHAEAAKWLQRAVDRDVLVAYAALGALYRDGNGVAQNERRAFELFFDAAMKNELQAQVNLGFMYETGRGVEQNRTEAIRYYRLAADRGSAYARDRLAILDR